MDPNLGKLPDGQRDRRRKLKLLHNAGVYGKLEQNCKSRSWWGRPNTK